MKLSANRIILFVKDPQGVADFYVEKIGLKIVESTEDGKWIDLDAGGVRIGLHHGGKLNKSSSSPKIVFYSKDVSATAEKLVANGAKMGSIKKFGSLRFCEGQDPEGNRFQISNRK